MKDDDALALTALDAAKLIEAFPDVPEGWKVLRSPVPAGRVLDLDAHVAERDGVRVLVVPGSDSWTDWMWNLMPGRVHEEKRWLRAAWYDEAVLLLGWLYRSGFTDTDGIDVATGHSRGAAVLYTATLLLSQGARRAFGRCRMLHLFGCPMTVRGSGDGWLPPVPTTVWRGGRDLVARAPFTRLLGWRLPAHWVFDLPGVRHPVRCYREALEAWASL